MKEIALSSLRAEGWVKEYLKTQAEGMTGNLDKVGEPFSGKYWDEDDKTVIKKQARFLGGLNSVNDMWVPFEQTGYWIDGMVRTAYLLDDGELKKKVEPKVYNPLRYADEDGYLGPTFLKDGLTWAHSVYFRSWLAAYSATGDKRLVEGLKKHYLRVPLKEVYDKHEDLRIIKVRDICDIEVALWLYGETGEREFLTMAEESYARFNKIYSKDRGVAPHCKMKGVTLSGMCSNMPADNNHGVTYCEICKLAAILHLHTGKEIYKRAAINAFEKLYETQMLIDGVNSSTEYLNGNKDSLASHETCDVADLTWALGYLYQITGDSKYGDRIEDAIFNGGLGCVDDDFKGHQYFSCPNQVLADDTSSHVKFYRGDEWMSYSPKSILGCCTGNVNRFMPNYVCRSWWREGDSFTAFLYAPTSFNANVGGANVRVTETTCYPFENTVRFQIQAEKGAKFTLRLRVPVWAKKVSLTVNGTKKKAEIQNGFIQIEKKFTDDEVVISFEDEARFIANAGGVSVKKGALLYALPIGENKVVEETPRGLGDKDYPHYSLYPTSKWNYALPARNGICEWTEGEVGARPWIREENGLRLRLSAVEAKNWQLLQATKIRRKLHPRKRGKLVERTCTLTPVLPKKVEKGEETEITLVPYCTTRLRIAIFPVAEE